MQPEKSGSGRSHKTEGAAQSRVGEPNRVLSPEAYNAVISQLVPLEVRLADFTFTLRSPVHSGPLITTAKMEAPELEAMAPSADANHYVLVVHRATFRIAASDEAIAAEGRAVFTVRLKLGFKPPEEFWPMFLSRNIRLYTHPPLRDLIASMAARAGLVVQPLASVSVTQSVGQPVRIGELPATAKPTVKRARKPKSES